MFPIFVMVRNIYRFCYMQECKCLSKVPSALLHYTTMTTRWRRWIVFTYSKHTPGPAVCVNTWSKLNQLFFIFGQTSPHLIFGILDLIFADGAHLWRVITVHHLLLLNWPELRVMRKCLTMVFIVHMPSRSIVNFTE